MKEEKPSPTVTHEALVMSCMIGVMENQEIKTTDIASNFLQTYTESVVQVWLDSILINMLLNIYPLKYGDKVIIERVKKVIYTVINHAL